MDSVADRHWMAAPGVGIGVGKAIGELECDELALYHNLPCRLRFHTERISDAVDLA
jgi:hypothetical protein